MPLPFDFPFIRSIIMEVEAWEMAHPLPVKAASSIMSSSNFNSREISSPQLGLCPSSLVSGFY